TVSLSGSRSRRSVATERAAQRAWRGPRPGCVRKGQRERRSERERERGKWSRYCILGLSISRQYAKEARRLTPCGRPSHWPWLQRRWATSATGWQSIIMCQILLAPARRFWWARSQHIRRVYAWAAVG